MLRIKTYIIYKSRAYTLKDDTHYMKERERERERERMEEE